MPAVAAAKAHVFVADPSLPHLSPADRHHLERVLRLRAGDEITVADGAGHWRLCQFGPGDPEPVGPVEVEKRLLPGVAVAFALTKGERPEWTVQKLTELGVDGIVPFVAERSIVRWSPERAATQSERWRRIAREAASQSRRAWLPEVADVARFADVVAQPGAALAEQGGDAPSLVHPFLVVGPEGGWSPTERAAAEGLPTVGLSVHVLRSETAAITAGALLCALRAGVVAPRADQPGP